MSKMVNLESFAGGAMSEKVNAELSKVLDNIYDPNTDATRTRKLTLTITFKPDDDRALSDVNIQASSKLAPTKGINTRIMIDQDETGKVVAAEYKKQIPGQLTMEIEKEENQEESNFKNSSNENVIDLKKVNNK